MASSVAAITDEARLDLATGYEPMVYDRPPQLTHPLVPATWLVSNTADGSIVSNVIDMSAYARFLLNGGDGSRTVRVLSEAAFARAHHAARSRMPTIRTARTRTTRTGSRWRGPGRPDGSSRTPGGWSGTRRSCAPCRTRGSAACVLQNGYGSKRGGGRLRAGRRAGEPGRRGAPRGRRCRAIPRRIPKAADFAGAYVGDRRTLEIVGGGRRPAAAEGRAGRGRPAAGPARGAGRHVPRAARLARPLPAAVRAATREGRVVEAFHGDEWFRGERYAGPDPRAASRRVGGVPGRVPEQHPVGRGDADRAAEGAARADLASARASWARRTSSRRSRTAGSRWGRPGRRGGSASTASLDGQAAVAEFNGGRWYRSFETLNAAAQAGAERDAGVLAAEAERVRQRERDVELARLVRRDVEVAVGVRRRVVDRGRDHAVGDGQRAGGALHGARGAQHVAGHRLGRGDRHRSGVLAQGGLDGGASRPRRSAGSRCRARSRSRRPKAPRRRPAAPSASRAPRPSPSGPAR